MSLSLKETFEQQAEWRREKAIQYPNDQRNIEAAEIFDRLAVTSPVSNELETQFDALWHGEASPDISEEWSQALREVGFYRWPETAEELVRDFVTARELKGVLTASNGDRNAFIKAVQNNPQVLKVMAQNFFAQNVDSACDAGEKIDDCDPVVGREYNARLSLRARALRLGRTASWDRADGERRYQIRSDRDTVVAGPNFELTLDDVEALIANNTDCH